MVASIFIPWIKDSSGFEDTLMFMHVHPYYSMYVTCVNMFCIFCMCDLAFMPVFKKGKKSHKLIFK